MKIQEIERAITQLSDKELAELMKWFEGHYEQMWDKQIKKDLESGRFDALLSEVEKEYEAGLSQPL